MATVLDRRHSFGLSISGTRARFASWVGDKEFEHITRDGLPTGWVAYHIEPDENVDNSERCRMLAAMPVVVELSGGIAPMEVPKAGAIISKYPLARADKWLPIHLRQQQEAESATHTPGPWEVAYEAGLDCPDVIADGWPVTLPGSVDGSRPDRTLSQALANARLIAAAPELLAALQDAYATFYDKRCALGLQVANAISKATGVAVDQLASR